MQAFTRNRVGNFRHHTAAKIARAECIHPPAKKRLRAEIMRGRSTEMHHFDISMKVSFEQSNFDSSSTFYCFWRHQATILLPLKLLVDFCLIWGCLVELACWVCGVFWFACFGFWVCALVWCKSGCWCAGYSRACLWKSGCGCASTGVFQM